MAVLEILFVAGVTAGAGIWPINILSQSLCTSVLHVQGMSCKPYSY